MDRKLIGKTILAWERGVRRNLGVIKGCCDDKVQIFSDENPDGYKYYELHVSDFNKWVDEGLYQIK